MEAIEFVKAVKQSVIENVNADYRELLDKTEVATDPAWKGILPVYKNLTAEQKDFFMQFLRVIQINTVSYMLGILDGTSNLYGIRESFELKTGSGEEIINGDLQELFLEMVEEE